MGQNTGQIGLLEITIKDPVVDPQQEGLSDCDFKFKVFGDGDGVQNDKFTFVDELPDSGTVVYTLFKNGIELATIVDDTYGVFQDIGTVSAFLTRASFIIDWDLVFQLEGTACYHVATEIVSLGTTILKESFCFNLFPYTNENADNTVRIDWVQNGLIRSELDYTGLDFPFSVRIQGDLKESEETITDEFLSSDYVIQQIQDEITLNYRLKTKMIPHSIRKLLRNMIQGNDITITDFNRRNNIDVYREYSLRYREIETTEDFEKFANKQFIANFTGRIANIIKTDF